MSSTWLGKAPPGVGHDWSEAGWAPSIEGVCIALLVLNTLFTMARLYTRAVVLKAFGIDDCFLIFAYGMTTAQIAFHFTLLDYGFGRHIWNIPGENAKGLFKTFFIIGLLPGVAYFFIKMTFFLTYLRMFDTARYMRILIWTGIGVTICFYVGDFFYDLFQCQPVAKAWNPFLKGHCAKESVPGGPTGIFNVISDTYILLLPIPVVWRLNMNWKRKVKLLCVFSLGLFTVCCSVVRLALTVKEAHKTDFTYDYGLADIWANFEWSVGLMVACVLVCPALWDRVLREPFTQSWVRLSSACQSVLNVRQERLSSRNGSSPPQMLKIHTTTSIAQQSETV